MNAPILYNFAPLAVLLAVAALLAAGPVVWVWSRRHPAAQRPARRLHALTLLTLFLTFDLTLFGTFTRLSDSGLGCPDWPGCYGNASPLGARHEIAAAQAAQPTGPVSHSKAWVEMVHRYWASGVGALILLLTAATWRVRRHQARLPADPQQAALSTLWPMLTLVWVCVQGAFGALTVTWRLYPAIVTLHLLGAVGLLVLLCVQGVRYQQLSQNRIATAISPALRMALWGAALLLGLQIALGGWVSANYAVLACTQFPICQDSWWPPMDFVQAFEIWRELGQTGAGTPLDFSALTAIHYAHRLMAYAVLLVLGALALRLMQRPALRTQGQWLGALLLLQLATGLGNVLLGWPLLAALLHAGGAAALAVVLSWVLCETRLQRSAGAQIARPSGTSWEGVAQ